MIEMPSERPMRLLCNNKVNKKWGDNVPCGRFIGNVTDTEVTIRCPRCGKKHVIKRDSGTEEVVLKAHELVALLEKSAMGDKNNG